MSPGRENSGVFNREDAATQETTPAKADPRGASRAVVQGVVEPELLHRVIQAGFDLFLVEIQHVGDLVARQALGVAQVQHLPLAGGEGLDDLPQPDADNEEQDRTLVLSQGVSVDVDEMQTKLDLAQAYMDMGDTEGARNLLGEVLAEGNDAQQTQAKEMLGRTPMSIEAVRPLRDGVIADFDMTEAMLSHFLRRVHEGRRWFGPRVVLSVPLGITTVQKRALFDAAARAGASEVYLLEEPRAAGLGAGIPIHEARAHMIVDIGMALRGGERRGHELEADTIERALGGRELGDDVAALLASLDHALQRPHLTLEPPEPGDDVVADLGRELHVTQDTPGGILTAADKVRTFVLIRPIPLEARS